MAGQPRRDADRPEMILVDTSVWVDFLRGVDSPQRRRLHGLIESGEDISITGIVLTEILQGIGNEKEYHTLKEYFLAFPIYFPQGAETYTAAAELYRECRKGGKTVRKTVDCIIAAVCLENDLTLLHKDVDFDRIAECSELVCLKA